MELALFTDSVSELSLEQALDLAVELEICAIEIATGGQSPAPHLKLENLLTDPGSVAAFRAAFEERGLRIAALNCSAWPLHPVHDKAHRQLIKRTIELAERLEVRTIVTMSGCGGDGPGGTWANWVWYPWPEEAAALLERQWTEAIRLWKELAEYARERGVERIALELHPLHLAYNVPTLLRLRQAVGPIIGANVDPSHFFWQQMDPVAVVEALAGCVYHVHLKDTELVPGEVGVAGVLDNRPFEDPARRAWIFRTIGRGHGPEVWRAFADALAKAGYDGVLSIENEDVEQPQEEGVREAAAFARSAMGASRGYDARALRGG